VLEAKIEEKVRKYALDKGLLVYKFTSPNRRSVPDRLFICPDGLVWFCEFKQAGKKSTSAQAKEQETLRGHNVTVFVVDNVDDGKAMVDLMLMRGTSVNSRTTP
jgi:hypothetical protein